MTDRNQGGATAGRGQGSSVEPLGTHPCDPLPPTRPHTSHSQCLQTADSKLEYMNRLNHELDPSPLILSFWKPLLCSKSCVLLTSSGSLSAIKLVVKTHHHHLLPQASVLLGKQPTISTLTVSARASVTVKRHPDHSNFYKGKPFIEVSLQF